jgi:gliding motility-associated-like protein
MSNFYKVFIGLIITLLSLSSFESRASHLTGGDFQYRCIGRGANDTIVLRLNIFRDCAGASAPTSVTIPIANSCGVSVNVNLTQVSVSGIEISFLCGPLLAQSTCNGGSLPGMEIYTYEATVVLPPSCNGALQASAVGGTPGYNYSWPMGLTGSDVDMLCAGTYIVTLQDNNGCIATDTHQLADITNLYLTPTVSEISCTGVCDGSISVTPTNGTAPFVYNWEDGTSGNSRTNLCPGIYSVTVMDSDGSQYAYWVNLQNPPPVFISFTVEDETCAGSCDGIIRTDIVGGNPPYTIVWTGGLTGKLAQNVCPGSYTVNVTDANGCTASATATVNGPTALSSTSTFNTPISCFGICNASVTINGIGGAAPYTYNWSNGYAGATQVGLCAGTYSVTTTDANGCMDIQNVIVTQPTAITANPVVTNATCATANGSITLAPSGGVAPYSYAWGILPNPGNVNTVTGLLAGSYTVTITDGNGCSHVEQIAVSNVAGPTSTGAVVLAPACFGGNTGSISLTPTGGTAPYSFLWSTAATTSSITGISAGDYVVTVTDNAGCKRVEVFQVNAPDSIEVNVTITDPLCNGNCNGSITAAPTGGTAPYVFAWSNGSTTSTINGLCFGSYSVTVTDANGCTTVQTNIVLNNPSPLQDSIIVQTPINCNGRCTGMVEAIPYGGVGPYTYAWSNGATLAKNYDLCAGSYVVSITDANGCMISDTIFVSQPTAINPTVTQLTAPGCTGMWSGGWGTCCRPAGAVNITNSGSASMYTEFKMNQSLEQGKCNNGVEFEDNPNAHPLRYVCLSDTLCYNFGVQEADGDSLVFELVPAKQTATTNVAYSTGYSATNPINGITLDPNTGEVCFVAQPVGRFVVAIRVSEYDPITGLFKGSNMRDILFIIQSCPPNAAPSGSTIQNFVGTGGATATGPNTIEMCEGDDMCFELQFVDSNYAVDTNMFIFTNLTGILVGPNPNDTATISNSVVDSIFINGDTLLRITSTICWTAPPGSGGVYNFYVGVNDEHCTVPKDFFRAITVTVTGSTVAWPDQIICGNQTAQIFASGGTAFSWQAISGDPVQVGINFSCDSCAAPIANPTQTTQYVVTSNVNSSCQNTDTVTITVAQDYFVNATPDTIMCNLDTVQLNAVASIPGTFTYQWNNAGSLSNDTISNPVAIPPGPTIYSITMTSADGCEKNSTANIFITPPFPLLNPIADDTVLCDVGDTAQLDIEFLVANATSCLGSYSQCLSTTNYTVIGTGTTSNSSTSFANTAPFGNFRKSVRQQYLYKASELQALGLAAGMITEIGFNVASVNGTASYSNYEIKMGCSADTFFTAAFKSAPTVVFPSGTVLISTGWNMIPLSTPYIWDGTSSLVVDICFEMLSAAATLNSSTYYHSPGFTSCVYYENNFVDACTTNVITNASFNRPNTRFGFCDGADPAAYTYTWYPNYNMSNQYVLDPFVWPDSTYTYSVIVNDTFGVCSDTSDITIYVGEIDAGPDTILCEGDSTMLMPIITTICPNGTETYSWSPTTGLSDPTVMNPMATVTQTTTYVLTYNNSCGCTMTDSVTITVNQFGNPNPVFTHPTCGQADGEILLQSVGGSAPYTFSIDSGNTFFASNLFTNLAMGGYTMQIMDSNGCLSPMITDTLINPGTPVIDSITLVDPSCFGYADGQITIFASGGTPPIRYSVNGGTNFSISNSFTGMSEGTYSIVVRDDSLCMTFPQTVQLVGNNQMFVDSILFSDLDCYQDSSGWIEVFGHGGTNPLTYSVNNGISYSPSQLFTGLAAGLYPVLIRDSVGCTTTVQIQAIGEPTPLVTTVNPVNDSCFNACGGSATLNVSGATPPYSYVWRKGANIVGNNAASVNGLCAGTDYEIQVTDSNGCEVFVPFVITHPALLVVNFVKEDISCFGANDGKITLTGTGGTAPYTYSIDGGTTFVGSNIFTNLTPGTYNIVMADSGQRCTAVNTVIINEPSEITLSTNITEKTICVAGCQQLVATAVGGVGAPYNFIWNQGLDSNGVQNVCPTMTTIYSVYAADSNGCTSDALGIVLNLYDSLRVDAGPDRDLCPGDTAQLAALVTGGDGNGYNYQWTPVSGLSGGFISNPMAYPSVSTLYKVVVTDNCETPAATDSVWVRINPIPTMGFYADTPTEGCEPFDITLVNTSTPVQFAEWTIGEDTKAHGFKVDITDLKEGVYDVKLRVITPFGCENEITEPKFITVYPLPIAKFEMNPAQTTVFNTIIQFTDQSIGNINAWEWDFSGLGSSTDQNSIFQYPPDTGTFPVILTVTSTDGCIDDQEELLRIGGEFNIYVPNSFTPNGDGNNDVFAPRAVGMDESKYKLQVYDRWGGIVFESSSLSQPWDGTVQGTGQIAQNGVYVWRIVAQDNTDNPEGHTYQGTVTLIR